MSLFSNRPGWAKAQTSETEEPDSNIFSHSTRSYREIVAEQERRKQAKADKKRKEEERRISAKREVFDGLAASASKRRRLSTDEDDEEEIIQLSPARADGHNADNDRLGLSPVKGFPVRRSPRNNKFAAINVTKPPLDSTTNTRAIDLGDINEDNDEIVYEVPPAPEAEKVDDESDDEFAELARRARQQRQQKERHSKKPGTPDVLAYLDSPNLATGNVGHRNLPTPPPPPADPIVQLFVTSQIPNTNPLIVHRKLSQRLQEIRQVWCNKQGFSEDTANDVFFIHKMRRVYDVTTCKSLGLDVDAEGNIVVKGADGKQDVDKVHLEAVTSAIFAEMKAEKARESQKRSGEIAQQDEAAVGPAATVPEAPVEESVIRLVLKAKEKDDFKLKVKPVSLATCSRSLTARVHC